MTTALAILSALLVLAFVVGAVKVIVCLRSAPEGFEAQDGFHYSS